jgi:hypothetical protein
MHMRQAESTSDQPAVAEQLLYLFRTSIGNHVYILGFAPKKKISHATAYHERLVARFLEAVQDLQRFSGYAGPGNIMLGPWDDDGVYSPGVRLLRLQYNGST